jgi:hypothetical protein
MNTLKFCLLSLQMLIGILLFQASASAKWVHHYSPYNWYCLNAPFTLVYSVKDETPGSTGGAVHYVVTISYDGSRLLYQAKNVATGAVNTSLYDGFTTTNCFSDERFVTINPGFSLGQGEMGFLPWPGVGIPKLPMLESYLYGPHLVPLVSQFQQFAPEYIDSALLKQRPLTVDYGVPIFGDIKAVQPQTCIAAVGATFVAGKRQVLWNAQINGDNKPGYIWEFYRQQLFEGFWIAGRINYRLYSRPADGSFEFDDKRIYVLDEATATSLPSSAFTIETYLPQHATISDYSNGHNTFLYEPGRGSLVQQEENGGAYGKN